MGPQPAPAEATVGPPSRALANSSHTSPSCWDPPRNISQLLIPPQGSFMRKRRREGGRRTGHHYIYYFRFYWGGREERRGVALQLKGLRHQKSHVHCPCPRGGAKLPGSASPGGGSRNAGLQPRPATTHRPTQGARNNQNENQTKKHTPKSRAPPPPQPQTRAAYPCNPPPKK